MESFEELLLRERGALERLVRFRIPSRADADDVLQEIYMTAYERFGQLRDTAAFRGWVLRIAQNKVNDYFRHVARQLEIPVENLSETALQAARYGPAETVTVRDALQKLGDKDKQILYLYFWKEMPQADIARQLEIPLGTVKSRLHTAKHRFRDQYLRGVRGGAFSEENREKKGQPMENTRIGIPAYLPPYTIEAREEAPFSVRWEELMGWFLVPRLGETCTWGIYDFTSRQCTRLFRMDVTGKAMVHGIEGVRITARESDYTGRKDVMDRFFVAQLTETHCRYLASAWNDGDTENYVTFLDGDAFLPNWGFGEDNCGNAVDIRPAGDIRRQGSVVTTAGKAFLLDVVGRYTVTIGGRAYDTICVMDVETYDNGYASEQFLDETGRTVLWRRFNRNDWAADRYGGLWTELLPDHERLIINGVPYVHWYDCITDHVAGCITG